MHVAVFRAEADGQRTAARLAALGHAAVPLPALRIVPTGRSVPAGAADALIFTSAHAPEALARQPVGIEPLRDLPCWCVGERTAFAAKATGFVTVRHEAGDGVQLARAILAHGTSARFAFVTGRDRKPDLERTLVDAGVLLTVVEAYAAEAVRAWNQADVARLATARAALHYSRRSATLASRLADAAGGGAFFDRLAHHCLSADVAGGLGSVDAARISVAARPDEESLLATLATLAKATASR